MNTMIIEHDMHAFGWKVDDFPQGIGPAFDLLYNKVGKDSKRSCFGLSRLDNNGAILYYAALEEKAPGEAAKYHCERFVIPRGEYLAQPLKNWRTQLPAIKEIFGEMMKDSRFDTSAYCIEWYQNDTDLLCLLQLDTVKAVISEMAKAGQAMDELLDRFAESTLNRIPPGSGWSSAQVVDHVTRSNRAMSAALEMPGALADRDPAQRREELRSMFMNFSNKFTSPAFIEPENKYYDKDVLQHAFRQSLQTLHDKAATAGYATMINLPGFGQITKLELLYFVGYHTKRHVYQLQNLYDRVSNNT